MAAKEISYLCVIGTSDGPCKISYSQAPKQRWRQIVGSDGSIIIVGNVDGRSLALAITRYVHWQLRDHHIRNEWFDIVPADAIAIIKRAINKKNEFNLYHFIPPLVPRGSTARLPAGIFERIDAVLEKDEKRNDFIREAIARELKRRGQED